MLVAAAAIVLALALAAPQAAAEASSLRGRTIGEALRLLQDRGLRIIFSTAVVDETLRIEAEPTADDPRAMLEEILRPHGLEVRDGPDGALLIVRAPDWTQAGILRGRVVSSVLRTPVAGAIVRVNGIEAEATTGVDGSFEIRGVPAGLVDVQVEATGFEPRTVGRVRVRPRRSPSLTVALPPLPAYLEQVVVVPSRVSWIQQEQNPMLALTDEEALLAPTSGGDAGRLVGRLPGVAAADNSGAFNVRGSLAGDVSIMLDGLELYTPFHQLGLMSPFSLLDMNLVDRLDFIGGPFTADIGDRHGGVVQAATWTPEEPHSTRVEMGAINSSVTHGGPMARFPASWLASARTWYPQAAGSHVELGEPGLDPRFGDAYLRFMFHGSPRAALSAHALMSYDAMEFSEDDGGESVDIAGRSGYLWLRSQNLLPGRVVTETVLSVGRLERSRRGVSDPQDIPIDVTDDRVTNFSGLKHDLTWKISEDHLLRGGVDARWLTADYHYRIDDAGDPASSTSINLHPSGLSMGGYVSWRAAITNAIAVETGLRWDRQGHTQESQASPRLNAVIRLGQRSQLRLGAGDFHQSQRIHELRIEDGQERFHRAELSRSAGLTFQHTLPGGMRLRFDAYARNLSRLSTRHENLFNSLDLYPETEPDRVPVEARRARLRGMEFLLQSPQGRAFNGWIGYARSSSKDVVDGRGVPRSWDQTHAVTFLAGYRVGDRWFVALSGAAHTGWPATPVTATATTLPDGSVEFDAVPGARNSDRLPSYARLDLKASRSFVIHGGSLRVDLEALNVTNRRNVCCVDEFDFRLRSGGSVRADPVYEHWLGITPALNLVWEF